MSWFYNSHTGEAENISGVADVSLPLYEALLHTGTGWHEYSTQALMNAAIAANHWPAANQGIQLGQVGNEAGGTATAAASGGASILGLPTFSNTRDLAVRAVKVVGGLMLLFIGLDMLAKETTNVDIVSALKSMPKVVPV